MHFHNSENKSKSIANDLSNDVEILVKGDFNGISIFNIQKQHFSNNPFSIDRCPNTQTSAFIDYLNYIVGSGMDV